MARDPLRKFRPPSGKQTAARQRNWAVWRLRGLYWNSGPLKGARLAEFREVIDAALADLGAEPETERNARKRRDEQRFETFRSAVVGKFLV